MDYLLALIVVLAALLAPIFIKRRGKKSTALAGALSAFDEVFHPAAEHAHQTQQSQQIMGKPAPSPEDK